MMLIVSVGGIFSWVRRGEPGKRIGNPDAPVVDAVCLKNCAHENGCAATPYACFDQVPWHVLAQNVLDTVLQVLHALHAYHSMGQHGPIAPYLAVRQDSRRTGLLLVAISSQQRLYGPFCDILAAKLDGTILCVPQ